MDFYRRLSILGRNALLLLLTISNCPLLGYKLEKMGQYQRILCVDKGIVSNCIRG